MIRSVSEVLTSLITRHLEMTAMPREEDLWFTYAQIFLLGVGLI